MYILLPVLALGGMAVLFGLILGFAGEKLKVEEDERIPKVIDVLPGANCGGCGFTGCAAFAKAVVEGKAEVTGCPVGGEKVAVKVADAMGIVPEIKDKEVAFVKCAGDCDKASNKYEYYGADDCNMAFNLATSTSKGCGYGCMGHGSCVKSCEFDAIHIVNGIAVVDKEKCVACKKCIAVCPKKLIELVPHKNKVLVNCNSNDNGKVVKQNCQVGCIGCKICEKNCEFDAIHVENNLAKVDYSKCTMCNVCVEKCPTKAILNQHKA